MLDDPFGTPDVGVVILAEPVNVGSVELPAVGLLDEVIPARGTTRQTFTDVGYGISSDRNGVPTNEVLRKQAVQRYQPGNNPSDGSGIFHGLTDTHLMLHNIPNKNNGSGCPGDSGSPLLLGSTDTVVAVQSGAYFTGRDLRLCGRVVAIEARVETPQVLDWLAQFL